MSDQEHPRPALHGDWTDFGGLHVGAPSEVHRIQECAQLQQLVRCCADEGRKIRARCFAHSMNGAAVPRPGEVLVDFLPARHVMWTGEGQVTVGAGLAVWELDQYVRRFGWKLPVVNDGGAAASSIGGFISAGGIGRDCLFYGGFWETVLSLTVVSATGDKFEVERDHPLFPWIFGSMGSLGLIFEASIELVPASDAPTKRVADALALAMADRPVWPDHLWLTLFVPPSDREAAAVALSLLAGNHQSAWTPHSDYEYFILHRRMNPPMVYGLEEDFIAIGMWGDRAPSDPDLGAYLALELDFHELASARGWRRYFQSELIAERRPLAAYIGPDAARRYATLKQEWDPRSLLNSAVFSL